MNDIFTKDRRILMFLFPIILFNSTGEESMIVKNASGHELNYMHLLDRYLLFHFKGNHALAAKMLGITIEILDFIQNQ